LPGPDRTTPLYFSLFNEIGIISQLAGNLFERRMPAGFLISHFGVLNHLVRLGDGRTPMEIATAFQVPKTTMTHTLAGLEKAGFIRFASNPKDGRSKCVFLTEAGSRFREDAIAALQPDLERLAETIPPESVERVLPVLEQLRTYLDEERDR
jgi:DNA-binding MarR family transcriptional regulator